MNLRDRIINFFSKKQKLLEVISIFLIFLGVSFKFSASSTSWYWTEYPLIALFISVFAVVAILLWIKIERKKVQKTINDIKINSKPIEISKLLTNRQQQVFDLILKNKSNKEISKELFIELSTLKTHINKIYKVLNIKNRKEAKNINL